VRGLKIESGFTGFHQGLPITAGLYSFPVPLLPWLDDVSTARRGKPGAGAERPSGNVTARAGSRYSHRATRPAVRCRGESSTGAADENRPGAAGDNHKIYFIYIMLCMKVRWVSAPAAMRLPLLPPPWLASVLNP